MLGLLATLIPIGLLDSLSMLPFAVVVLAVLLAGPKPYAASVGFLLGTFLSYLSAGVLIAAGLGPFIERTMAALADWFYNPTTLDYVFGIVVGLGLISVGYRWANARRARASRRQPGKGMTPTQAFGMGAGATLAGLWGALPYFAAIDQLLKADLGVVETVIALVVYNTVFVSVGIVLVVLKATIGSRADAVFDRVSDFVAVWGRRLVIMGMIALGSIMVADGIGWLFGHPVIPVG